MTRINDPDRTDLGPWSRSFLRLVCWLTKREVGRVVKPVKVMGHHPRILAGYGMMEKALASSHRVDGRIKALAEVRAATLVGCPF